MHIGFLDAQNNEQHLQSKRAEQRAKKKR